MALLLHQLLLLAADLMFASVLSCLFSVTGSLVVVGLVSYVVVLSCGAGAVQTAKKNIRRMKQAAQSRIREAVGTILGLVGLRGRALGTILKEECPSSLQVEQLPACEKKHQEAKEAPMGSRSSWAGGPCWAKMPPGTIWEEGRKTSPRDGPKAPVNQRKASMISVLLSILFAPSYWYLKKHFQLLSALLTSLKRSRD
ncbi:uncharacterized protein LOC143826789 [Paroedura picta]|uniref:uncharacterized protein LOC143826789 n=1 Tax=Paroedura picta TaxID=143630 RepID=UPI004055CA8F